MIKALQQVGEYVLLMRKALTPPTRWSMFFKQLVREIYKLGVDSIWIVVIISIFIGTVIAIQISLNISSPLIPKFTIGYTTREIILLEFSSSIMCLILFIPVLVFFSMTTGILGGVFASHVVSGMTPASFEFGLQYYFNPFYIWYSVIKSVVYAFLISSIGSYFGYNVKGGSLEVGKASTNAIVISSIMILLADVILTHIMLTK